MGSRDETLGCQLCVATVSDDGTIQLRLRLPDALAGEFGKYLVIDKVHFNHGHAQVLAALQSCREFASQRKKEGEKAARDAGLGLALGYRFKRDRKGWRVFVTTKLQPVAVVTDSRAGAVGVDVNSDHLAVCETAASGNPVDSWGVPLVTYGKSTRQAEALFGDAVAGVVSHARVAGKPVVMEKLDFGAKKASLEGESSRQSRMLSSFAYGRIKTYFLSRGYREGVEICQVNPAFSSLIGRVKIMERYGLSADQSAALVLARRLLGFSERIPRRRVCPDGEGGHVTFSVPAMKRMKHVWTLWGALSRQLRPVHGARRRPGGREKAHPIPLGLLLRA